MREGCIGVGENQIGPMDERRSTGDHNAAILCILMCMKREVELGRIAATVESSDLVKCPVVFDALSAQRCTMLCRRMNLVSKSARGVKWKDQVDE